MTGSSDLVPGFKFSRASYLLSLLRPQIYTDLELKVQLPLLTRWLVSYWGDSIFLTWEGSIVPHAQMSSLPEAFLLFQTVAHTSPRPTYQNLVLSQLPSVLKAWKSQIKNRPPVKRGLLAVQTIRHLAGALGRDFQLCVGCFCLLASYLVFTKPLHAALGT